MIEMLCVAAEVTAALLILSIFLPASAKKSSSKRDSNASLLDAQVLDECKASLNALRGLLFLQSARWANNNERLGPDSDPTDHPIDRLVHHLNAIEPLLVTSNADSATHLGNRHAMESFLQTWNEWSSCVNEPARVCLIQIDNIDQLDEQHGSIANEIALRHLAGFLQTRIAGYGQVVRFNHQSFALTLLGWSQPRAIDFFESIRYDIQKEILTIQETDIYVTASASLTAYDLTTPVEELWERLEDGVVEAVAAGANRGRWYEAESNHWQPMGTEEPPPPAIAVDTEESGAIKNNSDSQPVESAAAKVIVEESINSARASEIAPDEISSVDIASLFKAASANRSQSNKPIANDNASEMEAKALVNSESELKDLGSRTPTNNSELASLEPLPASEASNDKLRKRPRVEADTPDLPRRTKVAEAPHGNDEELLSATNDDIEALFDAFKNPKQPREVEAAAR